MSLPERWTILKTLEWIQGFFAEKGVDTPRLDAEVILAHVLATPRIMLYARFDQPLQAPELAEIKRLVARRARREPIAHLIGEKEFWSLSLAVNADCLIPRPDSETVVEVALASSRDLAVGTIVDVGTGSGCLALALAREHPDARVYALEASPAAGQMAQINVQRTKLEDRVRVIDSDLLAGLPAEAAPIDLLVANLPYIPTAAVDTLMPDVRFFEPRMALDGGPDGLELYRRLLPQLRGVLAPGAAVVFEAQPDQMEPLVELMEQSGLVHVVRHRDGAGHERVVAGRAPSA